MTVRHWLAVILFFFLCSTVAFADPYFSDVTVTAGAPTCDREWNGRYLQKVGLPHIHSLYSNTLDDKRFDPDHFGSEQPLTLMEQTQADWLGITDHDSKLDRGRWGILERTATQFTGPEKVMLLGIECTYFEAANPNVNHVTLYGNRDLVGVPNETSDWPGKACRTLTDLYYWLATARTDAVAILAHPWLGESHFQMMDPIVIGAGRERLVGTEVGGGDHPKTKFSLELGEFYWQSGLQRRLRLAPVFGHDNMTDWWLHKPVKKIPTAIWVSRDQSFSAMSLLAAMRDRRMYVRLTGETIKWLGHGLTDWQAMGGQVVLPTTVPAQLEFAIDSADQLSQIELVRIGWGLTDITALPLDIVHELSHGRAGPVRYRGTISLPADEHTICAYLRIRSDTKTTALSAPIWLTWVKPIATVGGYGYSTRSTHLDHENTWSGLPKNKDIQGVLPARSQYLIRIEPQSKFPQAARISVGQHEVWCQEVPATGWLAIVNPGDLPVSIIAEVFHRPVFNGAWRRTPVASQTEYSSRGRRVIRYGFEDQISAIDYHDTVIEITILPFTARPTDRR